MTGIKIVEGGQNYIDGEFLGLVSNSLEISGVFYTTNGKIERYHKMNPQQCSDPHS